MEGKNKVTVDCCDRRENCGSFSWCRECEYSAGPQNYIERWDYGRFFEEYQEYLEAFYNE